MSAYTPTELLVLRVLQDHSCHDRAMVINEATRLSPTTPKRLITDAFDRLNDRFLIVWQGEDERWPRKTAPRVPYGLRYGGRYRAM